MNITLSVDEKVIKEARKVANEQGTSLNQLIRDHLERLTKKEQSSGDLEEFIQISKQAEGQGHSAGWKFNRDELHERT